MATDKQIALESIIGSAALEGLTLPDEVVDELRDIIEGRRDADDVVAETIAKYQALEHAKKIKVATG